MNFTNLFKFKKHSPHYAGAALLQVTNLTVKYDRKVALDNISFELNKGTRVAVVGPNGAGKSTLFKTIAGITAPVAGRVNIYGSEPEGHICIGYVPQRSQVDWNFPVSVFDVVMMGRTSKVGLLRRPSGNDIQKVNDALEVVKLSDIKNRQISELSGGQQQRVFIARALAQEAEIMLMDESMTGLDYNSMENIFQILDVLKQKNVTVLISLHDINLAIDKFDQVMLLNHNLIGFGSPTEVFIPKNLYHAFGSHLHMIQDKNGKLVVADTCAEHGENPDD